MNDNWIALFDGINAESSIPELARCLARAGDLLLADLRTAGFPVNNNLMEGLWHVVEKSPVPNARAVSGAIHARFEVIKNEKAPIVFTPDRLFGDAFAIREFSAWLATKSLSGLPSAKLPPHRDVPINSRWLSIFSKIDTSVSQDNLNACINVAINLVGGKLRELNYRSERPSVTLSIWYVAESFPIPGARKVNSIIRRRNINTHDEVQVSGAGNQNKSSKTVRDGVVIEVKTLQSFYDWLSTIDKAPTAPSQRPSNAKPTVALESNEKTSTKSAFVEDATITSYHNLCVQLETYVGFDDLVLIGGGIIAGQKALNEIRILAGPAVGELRQRLQSALDKLTRQIDALRQAIEAARLDEERREQLCLQTEQLLDAKMSGRELTQRLSALDATWSALVDSKGDKARALASRFHNGKLAVENRVRALDLETVVKKKVKRGVRPRSIDENQPRESQPVRSGAAPTSAGADTEFGSEVNHPGRPRRGESLDSGKKSSKVIQRDVRIEKMVDGPTFPATALPGHSQADSCLPPIGGVAQAPSRNSESPDPVRQEGRLPTEQTLPPNGSEQPNAPRIFPDIEALAAARERLLSLWGGDSEFQVLLGEMATTRNALEDAFLHLTAVHPMVVELQRRLHELSMKLLEVYSEELKRARALHEQMARNFRKTAPEFIEVERCFVRLRGCAEIVWALTSPNVDAAPVSASGALLWQRKYVSPFAGVSRLSNPLQLVPLDRKASHVLENGLTLVSVRNGWRLPNLPPDAIGAALLSTGEGHSIRRHSDRIDCIFNQKVLWQWPFKDPVETICHGSTVIVIHQEGLLALDTKTGVEIWKRPGFSPRPHVLRTSPVFNLVEANEEGRYVLGISVKTGQELWRAGSFPGARSTKTDFWRFKSWALVCSQHERLFFRNELRLTLIQMSDGKQVWQKAPELIPDWVREVDGDRLLLGNKAAVWAIELNSGVRCWRYNVQAGSGQYSATVAPRCVLLRQASGLDDGEAICLNSDNGKVEWQLKAKVSGTAAYSGGHFFFMDGHDIIAVSAKNGVERWRLRTNEGPFRHPISEARLMRLAAGRLLIFDGAYLTTLSLGGISDTSTTEGICEGACTDPSSEIDGAHHGGHLVNLSRSAYWKRLGVPYVGPLL